MPPPEPEPIVDVGPTATPGASPPRLIAIPPRTLLTDAGHELIVAFEVGSQREYKIHPEWPGGSSGVTVGIGYDCGTMARQIVLEDWHRLSIYDRTRLANTSGILGSAARLKLTLVSDVAIAYDDAIDVFDRIDVTRTFALCKRSFPGFEKVRPNAQAAIVSLVFNRGDSMSGPNRVEMRDIRDQGVPRQDYPRIAMQIRAMSRIWVGTDIYNGMRRRREAEARLVEQP